MQNSELDNQLSIRLDSKTIRLIMSYESIIAIQASQIHTNKSCSLAIKAV